MFHRRDIKDGAIPQAALSESEKNDLFEKVFGVSPATLKVQGHDPTVYAKEHIKEALDDPEIRGLLLPREDLAHLDMYKWGWRGWLSLSLGIASLIAFVLLKSYLDVSIAFLAMAMASAVLAMYMIGKMGYYNLKYLHFRKQHEHNVGSVDGLSEKDIGGSDP